MTSTIPSAAFAPPEAEPLVLGVCAAIVSRFGASVPLVRAAFVVLTVAGGFGVLLYLGLAAFWRERGGERRGPSAMRDLGIVLITTGLAWDLGSWWPGVRPTLVLPVGLVAAGVALGWRRGVGDPSGRVRFRALALRVAAGLALCIGGIAVVASQHVEFSTLRDAGIALGVALGGVALVLGPSIVRIARSFSAERDQRIRAQERAEVAAHLHDSVLQTLTLIQKRAADPAATVSLARHQERSLRRWLYDGDSGGPGLAPDGWRAAAEQMVGEVEDLHAVAIELVMVGDGELTPAVHAVLGAAREALVNAAKFSGVLHLSMYAEWAESEFDVFVRDRGKGFDPALVGEDRRGISDSIVGRVRGVGGQAVVRSAPGDGTEVALALPLRPPARRSA